MVFVNVYLLVILSVFTPGMREKQNYVNQYRASRCNYLSDVSGNEYGRINDLDNYDDLFSNTSIGINSIDNFDDDEGDTSSPGLFKGLL